MNLVEKGKAFIEHHGVKGMRWGVRRSQAQLDRAAGRKSEGDGKKSPKTVVGKTKTEGKRAEDLSDANLKKVINRMNMEQQYKKLTYSPSAKKRAMDFVASIGVNVARTQLTNLANDALSKKVGAALASKSGIPTPPLLNRLTVPPNAADRLG